MPPDSPYLTSIWSEGVIKWTSMSAYLPLCSLAGAVAYWKAKCGDSKKAHRGHLRRVRTGAHPEQCVLRPQFQLLCPLVLYAGAGAGRNDRERAGRAQHRSGQPGPRHQLADDRHGGICGGAGKDSDTGSWSFGVLKNPGQYCAVLGFGLLGLLLYRYLCQKWRGDSRFAQRMTAAVLAFAFLFSVVHIGIGKFGQWYTDSDLVKQDTNALLLKNDLPEGDYRIDTYKIHDNIGMWLDKSCLQYFGSTAAPSILSFYPALGVKRDVRSEPELSIMHCGAF